MKEFEVKILLEMLSDITHLLTEMSGDVHYLAERVRRFEGATDAGGGISKIEGPKS
jgi:hypothetical protein